MAPVVKTHGEAEGGRARRAFEDSYVHVPRAMNVRYSHKNLCASVSYSYYERALCEMLDPGIATAPNVLQTAALTGAADRRYASFAFGEQLLSLSSGNAQDQHLAPLIHRRYDASGLQSAQQRLATLRTGFLAPARLQSIAKQIARQLFSEFQLLSPDSAASLQNHLERGSSELGERSGRIGQEVARLEGRINHLQDALSASLTRSRAEAPSDPISPVEGGRFSRLWTRLSQVIGSYAANPFKSRILDLPTTTGDTRQPSSEPIERELLDTELRLAVRNAEWQVLRGVLELLAYESEKNRQILNMLHRHQQSALPQASHFQKTRDYGRAGGEFLLNSEALTEAVMRSAFGNNNATQERWHDNFRKACAEMLNDEGAGRDDTVAEKMYDAIYAEVSQRLNGFTVVDAIMALREHNPNFVNRLRVTFEGIARLDFLSSGYDRHLTPQRFAALTYVSSEIPEVSAAFQTLLDGILQAIHVDTQITQVETEPEILRFCVVDYVPVTALRFYADSQAAFITKQGDPRYSIYPELAALPGD